MAMVKYEGMLLLMPNLNQEQQKQIMDRLIEKITAAGGQITSSKNWGKRELAYRIAKQGEAVYYLVEFQSPPAALGELKKELRFNENVLRWLFVRR
jgi:small subunit ribosomal protein S6